LSAVGNRLIIHDQNKSLQCPRKPHNKIHKISASTIDDEYLIVIAAAGREILYVKFKDDVFHLTIIYETSDWVCSLHFLEKPNEFIYLVKHNKASWVAVDPNDGNAKVIAKSSLLDKVTNYSSLISGANWNEALVFCGTALGELIVWSPKSNPGQLLSRITAHNGVIFSIDRQNDFLVTTSDDRSIKLWVLQSTPDTCVVAAKKTLFGHTGRIFCCKIITFAGDSHLISAGEDGTICVWNLAGSEKLAWQSQIVWKKKCMATVWSVDYDAATNTIYATTSTGNIFNYKFQPDLVPDESHVEETVGPKAVIKYKSHCTWKAFLLQDYTLAIFLDTAAFPQFFRIPMDPSCNLLKSLDNLVVLASKTKLTLIDVKIDDYELQEVDISACLAIPQSTMIRSVHILNKQELVFCTSTGICGIFVIPELSVMGPKYLLPLCNERFTTAAMKHDKSLLLADRCGNLHLFVENGGKILNHLEGNSILQFFGFSESEETVLSPKYTLKHLHGNMGITNLILHTVSDVIFTVRTTGHDNTIKMLFIDQNKHQLTYLNTEKIPITWVEKVISHPSGQTLVFGFNSSHFVGYRLGADDLLFQYQCGGGEHRSYG
jgi:WD40 repeat protein